MKRITITSIATLLTLFLTTYGASWAGAGPGTIDSTGSFGMNHQAPGAQDVHSQP